MDIRKRYILTGGALVFLIVSLVTFARFSRGASYFTAFENAKIKGPKDAPIHLVVYSDFQCPACRASLTPIEELRNQFSQLIQVEFRHYPLERAHRWTTLAASFAECAAEQGKFWEFHDRLFSEQPLWSVSNDALSFFARYSEELNLDKGKLEQCIRNPKTLSRIKREYSMGTKQEIQSTPTIFINGHRLVGALQLKMQGKEIVEEELKKLNKNVKA